MITLKSRRAKQTSFDSSQILCMNEALAVEVRIVHANTEEDAVHLTDVSPFLVEDKLKRLGANYERAATGLISPLSTGG
ncbi:hypothetical protein [Azospirillum canadense]|uniref:hypothetical protein n=1 Tax=Azospirillum canadense TaxID=403962 RepID=UPI002226A3D4|nr:hypothetical protein [Azospirillum canadense]MCW2242074.1 hypothetical protein [Azospirillum canadense]